MTYAKSHLYSEPPEFHLSNKEEEEQHQAEEEEKEDKRPSDTGVQI